MSPSQGVGSGYPRLGEDTGPSENGGFQKIKGKSSNIWRPSSLVNLVNPIRRKGSTSSATLSSKSATLPRTPVVRPRTPLGHTDSSDSTDSTETGSTYDNGPNIITTIDATETQDTLKSDDSKALVPSKVDKTKLTLKRSSSGWSTLVSIVLVEAKGLPNSPTDGTSHGLYCKIRLGAQSAKSKTVQHSVQPVWRERFQMHMHKDSLLKVALWDKGKTKSFMGSSVLDLSQLEKERTHEIWQQLDDGYGLVHLSVTLCDIRKRKQTIEETDEIEMENKLSLLSTGTEWKLVGQLFVKVVSAKGLNGRPSAYCTLEVDNERVRTHSARNSTEPTWNKNFVFNVYDITSTLDLKIYDSSLIQNALHSESLGRISIPLHRIRNGEMKWYALKDKSNRHIAKGNCPRVLLEMSLFWNPVKASIRLFQPREVKYIKKSQKFDISLVYKNIEFIRDIFVFIPKLNEGYKRLFEWENQELCIVALSGWLLFWYHFRLWTTPLLLLVPFAYFGVTNRHNERSFMRGYGIVETPDSEKKGIWDKVRTEKTLTNRIQQLPEMTLTITSSIDYIGSLSERLFNLASFKVPFLSYITMLILVIASLGFYFIPFNYLMMLFGIYKFSRNYFRSEKILNNDLEDFISRIPDSDVLNDWKELNVPEPAPVNGINMNNHAQNIKGSVMY